MLSVTTVSEDLLYKSSHRSTPNFRAGKQLESKLGTIKDLFKAQNIFSELNMKVMKDQEQVNKDITKIRIQAESFESQTSLTTHQLLNKTANSKKTIFTISKRLDDIQNGQEKAFPVLCDKIKQIHETFEMKLKDRKSFISEEMNKQSAMLNKLASGYNSKYTSTCLETKEIEEKSKENKNEVDSFLIKSREKIKEYATKLNAMGQSTKSMEVEIKKMIEEKRNYYRLLNELVKANEMLEDFEKNKVPELLNKEFNQLYQHISDLTIMLDSNITNTGVGIDIIADSSRPVNNGKMDKVINSEQENQERIVSIDDEITEYCNRIKEKDDDVTKEIEQTIDNNIKEEEHFKWRKLVHTNRKLKSTIKYSKSWLNNLYNDWLTFSKNNEIVQQQVNEKIEALNNYSIAEIVRRISVIEQKMSWCVSRINVWKREQIHASLQKPKDLNEIEKNLSDLEELIKSIDGKESEIKPYKKGENKVQSIKKLEDSSDETAAISEELPDIKLTYNDIDNENIYPKFEEEPYEEEEFDESKVRDFEFYHEPINLIGFVDVEPTKEEQEKFDSSILVPSQKENISSINRKEEKQQKPDKKNQEKPVKPKDEKQPKFDNKEQKQEKEEKPVKAKEEKEPKSDKKNQEQEKPKIKENENAKPNDPAPSGTMKDALVKKLNSSDQAKEEKEANNSKSRSHGNDGNHVKEEIVEKIKTPDGKIKVKKRVSKIDDGSSREHQHHRRKHHEKK